MGCSFHLNSYGIYGISRKLGQASGFQSYQYRMIEYALGYKTKHILEIYKKDENLYSTLQSALHAPSLYDVSIQALAAAGFRN